MTVRSCCERWCPELVVEDASDVRFVAELVVALGVQWPWVGDLGR